jgi:hypothetical protein
MKTGFGKLREEESRRPKAPAAPIAVGTKTETDSGAADLLRENLLFSNSVSSLRSHIWPICFLQNREYFHSGQDSSLAFS